MARDGAGTGSSGSSVNRREHATAAPTIGKVSDTSLVGLPGRDLDRQPSVRVEAGVLGRLWVQACSIAGRSHTGGSEPTSGQDSYSYRVSDDGALAVFAVADGLGSRRRSHVGAHVAAVEACARFSQPPMRHLLDGPVGRAAAGADVLAALAAVQRAVIAADTAGADGREVATTLLVAVLSLGQDRPRAVFVRVGDPSALLMEHGRFTDRSLVFGRPAGGPANALSACIPMKVPEREVEVVRVGDLPLGVAVVLVTDGVGNDLTASRQLREWFEQRWAAPIDAPGMLDTLRYRRQGSVDDRTAVVVFTDPQHAPPAQPTTAPVADAEPAPSPPAPSSAPPPALAPGAPVAAPPPPSAAASTAPRSPVAGAPATAPRRGKVVGLVVAGALVLVAAGVAASQLLGTDDGAGGTAAPMSQWAGPGRDTAVVLVPTDDGAVQRDDVAPVVADDAHVVASMDGALVAVDGCPGVQQIAEPPTALDLRTCADPVQPALAVPADDGVLLVLRGDVLHTISDGADETTDLGDAGTSPLVADATDVAMAGRSIVFSGPAGVGIIADPHAATPAVAVADLTTTLAACPAPSYVGVEPAPDGRVVVAATCGSDAWALASLDPTTDESCVVYTGDGTPPLPITTRRGDLVMAFASRGPADAVAVAPLDVQCQDS